MVREKRVCALLAGVLIITICLSGNSYGERKNWQRQEVNLRTSGGDRITAIYHPKGQKVRMRNEKARCQAKKISKKTVKDKDGLPLTIETAMGPVGVMAISVDSPPIDGFVPWIVVGVTDKSSGELDFYSTVHNSVVGTPLTGDLGNDYVIGLFDTGASACVMGFADATQAGIYGTGNYLTSNESEILGVTGSVFAWVSYPVGVFIDGLDAIEPNSLLADTSNMMGQGNLSIMVGQQPLPGDPDLPTAIGSPMSVYYTTSFRTDRKLTVTRDSQEYTSPRITMFEQDDPAIPEYPNLIPLELRPLGGVYVAYMTSLDLFAPDPFAPTVPSIIMGNLSQSLFFVHAVDLIEGDNVAFDKDRFMLDTGAQVSVIGSRIGARLGLDPADPNFEVEIQGVTGDALMFPGFYIDSVEIPALGEWMTFTNVPMVLIDIDSPEGGTLDGIIGMNMMEEFNFVLRGGGMFGQDDPAIEFQLKPDPMPADIAPEQGDGIVNHLDLQTLVMAWLSDDTPTINWNPVCDLSPAGVGDGRVDLSDFAAFAEYWLGEIDQ